MTRPDSGAATEWRAPGRVNLIGEHTDYNGGLALPFAIGMGCTAEVTSSTRYVAASAQQERAIELDSIADLPQAEVPTWVRYVLGPLWALRARGHDVPPLSVRVDSDVPSGSGLSSSAALVCAVTTAVADHLGLDLALDELVAISRSAENDVVGARTGGLDQTASLGCTDGHALLIDFADSSTAQVPLDLAAHGLAIVVVDTMVRHSHADGEYAARRAGCEAAAATLGVPHLGVLSPADLDVASLAEEQARYARHVVTECQRVRDTVALLGSGEVERIGPLLSASHASLRDDFRVTTPELDVAAAALEEAGALGARMTGGGFGGCVIGLIASDRVETAGQAVAAAFAERGWTAPTWFTTVAGPGARAVRRSR